MMFMVLMHTGTSEARRSGRRAPHPCGRSRYVGAVRPYCKRSIDQEFLQADLSPGAQGSCGADRTNRRGCRRQCATHRSCRPGLDAVAAMSDTDHVKCNTAVAWFLGDYQPSYVSKAGTSS